VAGSAGPSSSFTGSAVNYGGGGAGGPYTATSWSNIGAASGGAGGGGTGAQVKVTTNQGLMQYFRSIGSTPNNATSENAFTTGTCAAVSGNLAYSTDADFPCSAKDYFQGYATGYFIAPITGSITFYISSDDSSELAITVGGTTNKLQISTCCTTVNATWSGFTAGQAYPLSSYFTEIGGGANWQVYYSWTAQNSYTAQGQTIIPASQYAYVTGAEGLTQYFKTFSSPSSATNKEQFTTGTCGQRIGTINFATDTDFPCDSGAQDNFKGYATGYFVAPYTGDITFYSQSDDSSDMVITVNGVDREMSTSIGTATSTFSGFVQGQYYPIKAYFTENTGAASWKLDYSFTGQARTNIPATYLRTLADFTAPTIGTNGLGGGGGSGAAGLYKLSGAQGGSGTVIIKYLTQSDTATETFITAVVNQESPSGLMTLNIPAYVNVGSYTETITVRDAANSAPYLANITITINKATPTARLALPGSVTTATYGTPVAISATTSTPGNVVFKKGGSAITGCSSVATSNGVATCTWTPSIVETASITAILTPTDATNYNSSIETASALSVVVGKADTLTVTAGNLSATYSDDGRDELTVVPSATYSLSGLVSIDSITAVSYLYSGTENNGSTYTSSATSPKRAGTYSITPGTPTFSGTGSVTNYKNVVFTAGTLTINRSARNSWSASYNSGSNQTTYAPNKTESITVSNIGGGGSTMGTIPALSRSQNAATATYSTTSTTCSVDSSTGTISLSGVGSCLIQVVEAQTPNWVSETKTVTMTILRGPRTATISPAATTLKYGETTTASSTIKLTSDGATSVPDSATVTFSAGASTGCQIDAVTGVVTATKGSGTCSISVNYAQTSLYESATSTASVITLARANAPVVTTDSITAMNYTGSQIIVSPTYKVTGILARDISAILPLADVSSTASIAGISASTYTTLTSFSFIGSDNVNGVYWSYNSSVVPSEGGTYAVGGVGLGLRGGLDISNYETPTYITSQLVVLRINQETLTIENSFGDQQVPFKLYTTGGSTGLAVTYPIVRDGTATVCTVTGNMLSSTLRAGTCLVRAKMLGNRNYFDTFSETATINLAGFIPLFDNSAPLNPNTGITISSSTPLDKAADPGQVVAGSCGNACAPTITAVVNAADSTLSVMQQGVIKVTGTDFDNATLVILNRRVNVTSFILVSNSEIRLSLPESIGVGILSVSVQTPGGITPRNSDMTVTP
jgi:hypothetical protein